MDHFCYLCFVFVMLSCLFIAASWAPAGKGLISWFTFMGIFFCVLSISHVVPLVRRVSINDLCFLTFFRPATQYVQSIPADNASEGFRQYIEKGK